MILKRDGAEIHLTLSKKHKATDRNVCHLIVSDAKAMHDELDGAGVRVIKGLRDQNYSLRDFIIADPDGNRIDVGQRI